jgi:CheY-like chemotaxis protein
MTDLDLPDARILIVDDQEANILFLEELLQQGGYSSWRGVLDPRAAAAACAEFQPDLILLDLLMPDLDSFGVLAQLQPFLAAQAYLPILVLTVDLAPESKRRALAAGAKDFLAKPLDAIEVLLRVKNLLETRFLNRQLQQRADERIREQAALIDQANDAILVCDLADRITFWSQGAEKLYGWTAADVQGRTAADLLLEARPAALVEADRAVATAGGRASYRRGPATGGKSSWPAAGPCCATRLDAPSPSSSSTPTSPRRSRPKRNSSGPNAWRTSTAWRARLRTISTTSSTRWQ